MTSLGILAASFIAVGLSLSSRPSAGIVVAILILADAVRMRP